jgi:hypothetical protein
MLNILNQVFLITDRKSIEKWFVFLGDFSREKNFDELWEKNFLKLTEKHWFKQLMNWVLKWYNMIIKFFKIKVNEVTNVCISTKVRLVVSL